ncbi:MAG: glycoside hydrolase [Ferruginibacter sp.]|nr:glycoside hydrolase [Ferruginibacter sp.]
MQLTKERFIDHGFVLLKKKCMRCFGVSMFICLSMFAYLPGANAQQSIRQEIALNNDWRTIANDTITTAFTGFESGAFSDKNWMKVNVPHNWDAYEGYRRMRHGNRHGYAWYRKLFSLRQPAKGKRIFLFFEGVGSFATVWLNGKRVGTHAGGRTTFTIDITSTVLLNNQQNLLAVRADHPANIQNLPWVCGGCSDDRGFSEGSQPMGIFRPVHLIITNEIKVEPFGVHVWNDSNINTQSALLHVETGIKNYGNTKSNVTIVNRLISATGRNVAEKNSSQSINASQVITIRQELPPLKDPHLWSNEDPYLYHLITIVILNGKVIDQVTTPYGIRWISWPLAGKASSNQFFLNGKPVFINGIAEYEHLLGKSHAFSDEQIKTRVMELKAAGFNAFRDAHQPHNLRYQYYWDSLGILWWTQLSAHVWYDTPEFRANFKTLLTEWVKERRNSPSVIMWGLQNESKLPEDFARECTALIRELDPTASSQRLVSTCNGGSGTDWDVPQNWTGTYGGDPAKYDEDLKRQILVGEYGAWRTLDLHTEGTFNQNGIYSEDRMTQLMEMKVKLAEAAKDSVAGHFMWLLTSHDNPGRVQGGEGYRELDRIGPVNYKGLLTPWEEPLDAFYMYRANYVSKKKEPMVYIVSHTWPDRWTSAGIKDGISVYSNCDEVELFNDMGSVSLGKQKNRGIGTHFQWDSVIINYNILYAVGYVNGKAVAKDYIVLNHLLAAPHFNLLYNDAKSVTAPAKDYYYIYRVNCGGPAYTDQSGNNWLADKAYQSNQASSNKNWGSYSWTNDFKGIPSFFASQRKTNCPVKGTRDWKLFQSFRYGREKLSYQFPVPDGEYLVELYFIEPWLGIGGGMDCTGWRLFDVAINGKTVLKDLDIWESVGNAAALKKTVKMYIKGGRLTISFPAVSSGQAVISAIAIASLNKNIQPAPALPPLISGLAVSDKSVANAWKLNAWLDTGDEQFTNEKTVFNKLPPNLYGAEWVAAPAGIQTGQRELANFIVTEDADIFIAIDSLIKNIPAWLSPYEYTNTSLSNGNGKVFVIYKKRFKKGAKVVLGGIEHAGKQENTMYTVMANAATTIEPAYDLKPVISLKAVNAGLQGPGLIKGKIDGKDRVIFTKASGANLLEWNFNIGAADIYSFSISYNNPAAQNVIGILQFFSADGKLIKEEKIAFIPTRPGKSNYISSSSGSMINAGNYKISLQSRDAEGVSINSLDIQ